MELDSRLQRTQEELTLSYKRTAENTQHLLDLNKQVKELEDNVSKKDAEYVLSQRLLIITGV